MKTFLKISIFALFLALGIQTQAQFTLPPPSISNITFSQDGCLLNIAYSCSNCTEAIAMYYYDALAGSWIKVDVYKSIYNEPHQNIFRVPLCSMDTAVYHTVGLLCIQEGITYRVTTTTNSSFLSGAKAYLSDFYAYSPMFFLPVISTPECAIAPPPPATATPAKQKGKPVK